MRKRTSLIWTALSDADFINTVKNSQSMSALLRVFGLQHKGGNFWAAKKRIKELGIDSSHFNKNRITTGRQFKGVANEEVFVENSSTKRSGVKKRILRNNILENICSICKTLPIWNGKPLVLILDHINGISNDHRIVNLRLVCPNCNSQLSTFAGRNVKHGNAINNCLDCNNEIPKSFKSGLCKKCVGKRNRKKDYPDKDILLKEVEELGYCGTGRKYGVSDNTIRKWIKILG